MIERELERKIEDFRELGIPPYVPREGSLHLVAQMVSTAIGARRSGKSYRVLQAADELIKKRFIRSTEQICLIDFDNPILSHMNAADLPLIQSAFLKLNPEFELNTPLVFILDEIHKISGWEEYVIDLSRNPRWRVFVTGSSSKLLRDDLATELRGKAISSTVYPLDFGEFLKFKEFRRRSGSTTGRAEIKRLFDDYLKWGGYPAVAQVEEQTREALLREYFDTMILRDIIQRYDVSKPQQCIRLYNYLLANISKGHTLQSAYRYLKQNGFSTSRDAVREYVHRAQDSWLLFMVPIFSNSVKEQERNYKKLYCIDWGLANKNSLGWDGSYSQALENLVFVYLLRRWPRVHYYLTRKQRQEVDFIAVDDSGHPAVGVQVCMDLSQEDTLKRELEPLVAAARYFGIKENVIVTYSQEEVFRQEGVTINAVPAWKWLLEAT